MPLVFPWERRLLIEKAGEREVKLEFKPYIAYRVRDGLYAVAMYKWIINGKCPFLNDENLCSIHDVKPLACKMYPLIIGWDDKTLRVSGACPWIRDHLEELRGIDPSKVFPEEFRAVVEALAVLDRIEKLAAENGWERLVGGGFEEGELIDIDYFF